MSTSSHADFILPGTAVRGRESWTLALAYAYDPWYNIRRVESPFYGIWDAVLNDLVFDVGSNVFVVPQLILDTGHSKGDLDPNTSMITTTRGDADEAIPDFAVVEIQYTVPPDTSLTDIPNFSFVTITNAKTPALVEVKRPPTRRALSLSEFNDAVQTLLADAQEGLCLQADNAFRGRQKTRSISLIACCGVWWCWARATPENLEQLKNPSPKSQNLPRLPKPHMFFGDNDEIMEDSADELPHQALGDDSDESEDHSDEPKDDPEYVPNRKTKGPPVVPREMPIRSEGSRQRYTVKKEPPVTMADVLPYRPMQKGKGKEPGRRPVRHFLDLGEPFMAVLEENVQNARPDDGLWSRCLHLGSPSSNQHLYLIHDDLTNGSRG